MNRTIILLIAIFAVGCSRDDRTNQTGDVKANQTEETSANKGTSIAANRVLASRLSNDACNGYVGKDADENTYCLVPVGEDLQIAEARNVYEVLPLNKACSQMQVSVLTNRFKICVRRE